MNRPAYYNCLRTKLNLTTQNVQGMEKVLDYAEQHKTSASKLPYIVATAWWETNATMHPVKEAYWMSESWRKQHLRYYPWYGRGLIQVTWEDNYKKMWRELGLQGPVDPERFLDWNVAVPSLFVGMEKGLYTGKDLSDYIDEVDESDEEDLREFKAARRIVNVQDKALTIGKLALTFEKCLKKGEYVGK